METIWNPPLYIQVTQNENSLSINCEQVGEDALIAIYPKRLQFESERIELPSPGNVKLLQ